MKDMTAMIRPQFKQVHPVDYKFASSMKEIDEFKYEQQIFRYNDLKLSIPARYQTLYGIIDGILEFNKCVIQFKANKSSVTQKLLNETSKEEKDITPDVLSKFNFIIHLEDLYSVNEKDGNWIYVYIFGVDGIDIPVLDHQNEISVIAIKLLLDAEPSDETTDLLNSLINNSAYSNQLSTQVYQLLAFIMKLTRYQNNKRTFRSVVHRLQNHKLMKSQMTCLSQITYYDIVALNKLGIQHKIDYYQPKISTLNKPSRILQQSHFELLANNMPQQVAGNVWFQVFNPKFHGTSFQELLRRTKNIKEHFIIIKDETDIIFGAFLERGWHIDENFYGGEQSFIFTFKNNGYKIYRSSKLNDCYQKCDESSLQVGGDQPAIKIGQNLLNGELNGSLTFGNELLSKSNSFVIQEFEVWGVQEDCELVMRHLRLESVFHIDQQ